MKVCRHTYVDMMNPVRVVIRSCLACSLCMVATK
jgi:hypothetical protein